MLSNFAKCGILHKIIPIYSECQKNTIDPRYQYGGSRGEIKQDRAYSSLSESAGFALAALRDCLATVRNAMLKAIKAVTT